MIRYYFNIFKRVAAISVSSMLAYRSNVVFFLLFESFFMAANFGGLALGVNLAGGQLGGWSMNEVLFVASLYNVGHQIFTSLCISGLFHTGWFVWSGRMDYVLLKPLHPLIGMHAANEFIISNIPNIIISLVLLGTFSARLASESVAFTVVNTIGLLVFFAAGLAVRYGVALLVVAPAFFAEKLAEGEDAYWSLQSLAKYPTGVFPRFMQALFSFILPIASIAAIPAEVFFGRQNLYSAALHLLVALVFTAAMVKFYGTGARCYQSVNTGA
jgi:ABC-2 type transport system permease protein